MPDNIIYRVKNEDHVMVIYVCLLRGAGEELQKLAARDSSAASAKAHLLRTGATHGSKLECMLYVMQQRQSRSGSDGT